MSRHRSSSKRPPPEIGLHMECEEEELEPSQIAYYNKAEKEYNEVQAKLDSYIKKMKAEVVEKGENCLVLQLNATPSCVSSAQISNPPPGGKSSRQSIQTSQSYQQISAQGILTRSNSNAPNTYLVMDPRLGFMVGQMQTSNVQTEQVTTSNPPKAVSVGRSRQQATTAGGVMVTTRAKSSLKKQSVTAGESDALNSPVARTRQQEKKSQSQQASPQTSYQQQQVFTMGSGSSGTGNYKIKVNSKPSGIQTVKPNESNALGGLSAGGKDDSSGKSAADSREVTFSKLTGKIFPSLVVVARPHLKLKYIPQSTIQQERSALDAKVKGVLMYTSTKFIEWLIQQGLIKSEQSCQTHINNDLSPVKLKLGMYSDVSKFPYSGGYVWISDCCPQQFVSVFSGSIFEGAPHPPTTLLKLIYHWACQTNVQNVVQWVKVDNLYLKNFYTNMRAVCTQAVHEKFKKLGGPRKKIEVGVISLGTTSQDGNKRQVKVEVLGVMDQENKTIRLRAVEPPSEERSFKRRFVKILEPLEDWVHKDSVILTDFTVAKAALNAMGFNHVYQVTNDSKLSNQNVMEYLRRIVPRMFQSTLSLLSRQIIQQFLDELVWREMWGPIPSQAFVTIISHLSEQTKLDVNENFLVRLNKVAANPFKSWNYSAWKPLVSGTSRGGSKGHQKSAASSQESIPEVTIDTPETPSGVKGIRTRKRAAEQPLSEAVTPSSSTKKLPKILAKEKQKKEDKNVKKEATDKLSDEIVQFINEGKQISLEKYYYGSKEGDEVGGHLATGSFNVKCCVCNKRFADNVTLMKHMILHCQADPVLMIDLKKVHQCENCFVGFNTGAALKLHLQEMHFEVDGRIDSNLICHICEQKYNTRVDLIYHMHRTHVELEMPYECGVCRFRTSVYKVLIDHFMQIHKNEEHVFCPYCLKVVTFSYKGEPITSNVLFYISHLEKHQRLTLVKDCNRCQLSFIHKGILDQHTEADHGSWKSENGVTSIDHLPTGILMPEPSGLIKPSLVTKSFKNPKSKNMFAMNKFKSLETYGVDENMACTECEGSLTFSEHFTGTFNCLKCRYSTCCEKAMAEHFAIFHETPHPQFTKGRPVVLPQEMFCVCGYSTSSGNRMAKHLATCERESAYPNKEAATAAVQLKEVADFDEASKPGEGQNVLNMLGLIRKSPEATHGSELMKMETDEENWGVEDSLKEGATEDIQVQAQVQETSSQEESDTSESRQEISVIHKVLDPPKTPKDPDCESEAEAQESEDKTEAEDIEIEPCSLSAREKESNPQKPSDTGTEVTKGKLETEAEESGAGETERGEKEAEMEVDEYVPTEEKSEEAMEVQSTEKLPEIANETMEVASLEEPNSQPETGTGDVESAVEATAAGEPEDSHGDADFRETAASRTIPAEGAQEEDKNMAEASVGNQMPEGSGSRHSKSLKKSKAVKKAPEKLFRGLVAKDSRQLLVRQTEKIPYEESQSSPSLPVKGKCNIKTPQLEKWKQEGSEWKTMKKIDYQRLETVLEEVQLSGEATCSKMNSDELGKGENRNGLRQAMQEVDQMWPNTLFHKSLTEYSQEFIQEKQQHDQPLTGPPTREREDKFENEEPPEGSAETVFTGYDADLTEDDESGILNRMIEILPIFSNDKFVCSRDAISVEESDDLEATDKHSGKIVCDSKTPKDTRPVDLKHLLSVNCVKKTCDRLTDRLGDFKEPTERKFRHKIIIDKNVTQATSSHFINFLLLLTPFSEEREILLSDKKLLSNIISCKGNVPEQDTVIRQAIQGDKFSTASTIYFVILAIAALTSVILGLAWRSYKPPSFLDFFYCVPFFHRRRTFVERFFDNLVKIINGVFGD